MGKTQVIENIEKTLKETFGEFLGLKEGGSLKRNLLGSMLVMLPEVPAYFIPAYSEAKSTGNAENVKKGEGARGLLSGALEGLAVGAIVSTAKDEKLLQKFAALANTVIDNVKDEKVVDLAKKSFKNVKDVKITENGRAVVETAKDLSFKRILPFVIVGASIQFVSSKIFPIIGEKIGKAAYKKNQAAISEQAPKLAENPITKPIATINNNSKQLSPINKPQVFKSGYLKI